MGKYMYYLSSTLVKKKGIWITAIIGMLFVFMLTYFEINDANKDGLSKVTNWTTFDYFLPFIFGSLMTTFFVLHVFKSGENDGTELLVVAKPLTRTQIIFGKFFIVIIAQILYHVILMSLYGVLGSLDKFASTGEKIKYIFSFVIGGLIIQIFMIGLVTIFSSMVGKVGTIVISILFTSILPIASFMVAPLTGAYSVKNNISDYNYLTPDNAIKNTKLIYGDSSIANFKNDQNKNKYKVVSYFDPWYHWGRFYSLFIDDKPENSILGGNLKKYNTKDTNFDKDDFDIKLKIIDKNNNPHWYVILSKKAITVKLKNMSTVEKNYFDKNIEKISKAFINDLNNISSNNTSKIDTFSKNKINNKNDFLSKDVGTRLKIIEDYFIENKKTTPLVLNNEINVFNTLVKIQSIDSSLNKLTSNFNEKDSKKGQISLVSSIEELNKSKIAVPKEYIKTSVVIIIWSGIGVLLMGISMILYFKRDFK